MLKGIKLVFSTTVTTDDSYFVLYTSPDPLMKRQISASISENSNKCPHSCLVKKMSIWLRLCSCLRQRSAKASIDSVLVKRGKGSYGLQGPPRRTQGRQHAGDIKPCASIFQTSTEGTYIMTMAHCDWIFLCALQAHLLTYLLVVRMQ